MLTKMKWLMNQEGADPGAWLAALPPDLQNDPTIVNFKGKSVADLAKAHVETKKLVGSSIRPLGQNATPEEKKQFVEKLLQVEPALIYAPDGDEEASKRLFRKLGRPEKPEEYKFDEDAATAAGLKTEELRAIAVTAGLTKDQAARLAKVMVDANLEVKRQQTLEQQALDAKWGAAKEERTLTARAAAMKMGLNEQEAKALTPKQLEAYYNVGRAIGVNENEFRQHGNPQNGKLTPDEVNAELAKLRADPHFFDPWKDPAKHKQMNKRAVELTAMLP